MTEAAEATASLPAVRLLSLADVSELTALVVANRTFMAPWDPVRPEAYYTEDGQRAQLERMLRLAEDGSAYPAGILDDRGRLAGRITLTAIERAAFQSGRIGYWVAEAANGRGLASRAVADITRIAFHQLDLHRIEAGTLVHNVRSQRVLERNGFRRFGTAPAYLRIAGRWQDHHLFQRLAS